MKCKYYLNQHKEERVKNKIKIGQHLFGDCSLHLNHSVYLVRYRVASISIIIFIMTMIIIVRLIIKAKIDIEIERCFVLMHKWNC